ncbi:MAG: MATE family efflux transporter [Rhizobiaceae bacterium]
MQEGKGAGVRIGHRSVVAIALPMTLAYMTTPLIGLVDTAVVGQFGDAAMLGGLAAGAILFDLVFGTCNFLQSGTTGLVAQASGRVDLRDQQAIVARALAMGVALGIALALAAPLLLGLGQAFIDADAAVDAAMADYVGIRMLGSPLTLANFALLGFFVGRGEAGVGLAFQLLLNGTNIVLSVMLGLWLGWGIEGVAWGTVGGELAAALAGVLLVLRRLRGLPRLGLATFADPPALLRLFALNRDIMIRSFVLVGAFALFARKGAGMGTATLAANAVLMNFFMVGGFFLDGFAAAAEQLVGRSVGAGRAADFRRAVILSGGWGFALAAMASLVFMSTGVAVIELVARAGDVRSIASTYLFWAALTPLTGVLAFQMDGVYIGATWSRDMRNMMLLSFAFFAAALWVLPELWGNHGLWAALHVLLLVRGISLAAILPGRARRTFL